MDTLKQLLDAKVAQYNRPEFIAADPVSIPHLFHKKQDIEIAGLFAALFAWGNRTIIIKKSRELMERMDMAPYEFILGHTDDDLKKLLDFKHRTFNATDLLYFVDFLQRHYQHSDTLETAFVDKRQSNVEDALNHFYRNFTNAPYFPQRTAKHVAAPCKKSHCKRLNMYLRWMVRQDKKGVDFGLWQQLKPKDLIMPVDVHVARVAIQLGLMQEGPLNWNTAVQLTDTLKLFDAGDPVKYDFALFGMGINQKPLPAI